MISDTSKLTFQTINNNPVLKTTVYQIGRAIESEVHSRKRLGWIIREDWNELSDALEIGLAITRGYVLPSKKASLQQRRIFLR